MNLVAKLERKFFEHGIPQIDVYASRRLFWFGVLIGVTSVAWYAVHGPTESTPLLTQYAIALGLSLYQLKRAYPMLFGFCQFAAGMATSFINLTNTPHGIGRNGRLLLFIASALLIKSGLEAYQKGFDEHKKQLQQSAAAN